MFVRRWRGCIKSSPLTVAGSSNRGTKEKLTTHKTGKTYDFADATPTKLLTTVQDCWVTHRGESWHGFKDIPDNWRCSTRLKSASLLGMGEDGELEETGVPAAVTAWLVCDGIATRTTDFQIMFLFVLA
ncbi:hypothetical protein ACLB1S_02340 [Escherichia coli]